MSRILHLTVIVLLSWLTALAESADPGIAITVTSNGQPVSEGQTVSGTVNITVTVTNGIAMHVATYGNMIFLPFNEPGHAPNTPVWSHTTQVDTRRFYDGENLLSVHAHPHNHAGEPYGADFTFATFKIVSENSNPAPNGDRLLPTLVINGSGWTPTLAGGEYYLSGDASVADDKTPSGVGREFMTAAPVQIIAHLGESVLGRFRWNNLTPPFGDQSVVSQCHLRPFQQPAEFDTKVVFFFTDGAGRANYATRAFRMPALSTTPGVDLSLPFLDGKIVGLGDGGTLRVPDGGTAPLYVQVSNLLPGVWTYPEMTTWIGNRAVKVTNLLPYLHALPEGATSVIVEVPIPADEVQRIQAARQGGEMSTATPIWVDFNRGNVPCLPVSSHVHLNSVRTTSYPWPYGQPTVVITKPWNNSGHWTGTSLAARYDQWGPLPAGYRVRWSLNGGSWQVDDGDGAIALTGLTRQSHRLEVELTDAALVRLPGTGSFAAANFIVVDAAPVAVADTYTVSVNGTLNAPGNGVLANDQDADGDPMTVVLVSQARHGSVSLAASGSFTYVPTPGFVGFDRFSYRASDGTLSSQQTDVRIQVTAATSGARVFGDWPMLGRDAEHSGYTSGFLGSTPPTLSWTIAPATGAITGTAVVGGKVVASYFANGIRVGCFNATSGQREWETVFNAGQLSSPAIGNGLVYVQRANHSSDSQMIALDLSSGAVRWSTPYADQWSVDWAPTVADGSLWVSGGYYGGLYGYDAITGAQRFFQELPFFDNWTPAYRGGKLFTWLQGTVRRHHALTGAVELSKILMPTDAGNGWVETMPVLAEDRLVLRDYQRLIVVDPTDFSHRWQRMPLAGSWVRTPVVHDGIVYALAGNSLEVLDLANGRLLGVVALPDASSSAPIVTDDAIIVSCNTSYPYTGVTLVIDRASLTVRYTLPYGGSIVFADNALYISQAQEMRRFAFPVASPVNRPPVALADAFSTAEDTALTISTAALLANDSDADGNPLSVQVVNQPANGALTPIAGGYRYDPPRDWFGTTTFTYVANDGQTSSQPATVTITVTPVEDPPLAFKPGLLAQFFDYTNGLSVIPDLAGRTADVTRTDAQIAYASVSTAWSGLPTTMADTFATRHSGWLKVDTAGSYTLFVSSDDGSRVYLDGALLINNDGLHGMQERSATVTLAAGYHPLRVEFFENGGGAGLELRWQGPGIAKQIVPASALWQEDPAPPYVQGLLAEFFDYTTALSLIPDLTGRVPEVSRTDAQIAYASVSTAWSGLPTSMAETFASRHSGWLKVDTTGSYTLFVNSDDGSRVYLDGALLIDNDGLHGMREYSATLTLAAGYHPLRVEFFENGGGAGLQFSWSGPGITKQLVPASALWRLPSALAGLPAPWVSSDVGAVGLTGAVTGDGEDFAIQGGGADIWNNADAFHFVHQPLLGDGALIARVVSLGNTNPWAKAGVMVRASTDAGSVHGMMVLTPANGASFQNRTVTGGSSASASVGGRTAPGWVRIMRSGTTLSGWVSDDGITWAQVGATINVPLGASPRIGLAVTAHDNAVLTTAVFEQVVFVPAGGG